MIYYYEHMNFRLTTIIFSILYVNNDFKWSFQIISEINANNKHVEIRWPIYVSAKKKKKNTHTRTPMQIYFSVLHSVDCVCIFFFLFSCQFTAVFAFAKTELMTMIK